MPNRSPSLTSRPASLIFVLGMGFFVLIGLHRGLERFSRPFWQDPIKHNVWAFEAPDFGSLRQQLAHQRQPLLSYLLRRYVVFPLAGFNERAFRLPDLIFYLALLACAPFLLRRFLLQEGDSPARATLLALASGAWLLTQDPLAYYAGEGRHYSLTAFASVLWFGYVFLSPRIALFPLTLLSLFYFNTHFFALGPVGLAFLGLATHRFRHDGPRSALGVLAAGAGVVAITVALNLPEFRVFLLKPPYRDPMPWMSAVLSGTGDWAKWLGSAGPAGLLLPLCVPGARSRRRVAILLAALGLALPGFFFLFRWNHGMEPHGRYLLPFFGLLHAAVLLGMAGGVELVRRARNWFDGGKEKTERPALAMAAGLLALLLVPALPTPATLERGLPPLPAANFTEDFHRYRRLGEIPRPKFALIHSRREFLTRHFYWTRPTALAESVAIALWDRRPRVEAKLDRFFAAHPAGLLVVDTLDESLRPGYREALPRQSSDGVYRFTHLRHRRGRHFILIAPTGIRPPSGRSVLQALDPLVDLRWRGAGRRVARTPLPRPRS